MTALAQLVKGNPTRRHRVPGMEGALFSERAQKSVLGSALLNNSFMHGALALLSLGDFLGDADQALYALMLEHSVEGEPFDFVSLAQSLEERGQLGTVVSAEYLASLTEGAVADVGLVRRHVETIQRLAQLRRLQSLSENIASDVRMAGADPSRVLQSLMEKIIRLQAGCDLDGDYLPYAPTDLSKHADLLTLSDVQARDVDWLWRPYLAQQTLAMLSGDPGAGKTYTALAISAAVTVGQEPVTRRACDPGNVLYLSVENHPE
jgi:replicative DNA helicase